MAVADQDVGPAVVVHVEKPASPPEILGMESQTGGESCVLEVGSALIVIERRRISCEICFYDVEVAIEIVVGCRDAHAGLRLAVGTQGAAGFKCDVLKLSVLLVLIKRASGRGVGAVDVGPSVVVEIGGEHTEPVGPIGVENA